jgi:ESS family glutamate:Na+ symporter
VVLDFGILSALLIGAHLLRARVRLLQDLYLPSAMIAGLLGFLGGRQVLDVLPFHRAGNEPAMAGYPSVLVVLLFATLFLGARPRRVPLRETLRNVGDTFFYNLATQLGQYGAALLFGLIVLTPLFPGLNDGFALMLPAGFAGGHGTATAVGGVLVRHGWDEALSVGFTLATAGLLAGNIGGMLLVFIATRRGWTRLVRTAHTLPEGIRRGFVPEEERASLGQETVSPLALDPLAWHVALVLAAYALAHYAYLAIKGLFPGNYEVPLFALSMPAGACLQKGLDAIGLGSYVDRHTMVRIGSTVSDFLVAFGIASIRIEVVTTYALPLAIMAGFGVVYSVAVLWLVGRRIYHNFWFERSLFVYGWNTGVIATSVTLLRVVDPRLRTKTLEDYGLAYVFISGFEIAILVTVPALVAAHIILVPALALLALAALCVFLSFKVVGWFTPSAQALRSGEEEVIDRNADGVAGTASPRTAPAATNAISPSDPNAPC